MANGASETSRQSAASAFHECKTPEEKQALYDRLVRQNGGTKEAKQTKDLPVTANTKAKAGKPKADKP